MTNLDCSRCNCSFADGCRKEREAKEQGVSEKDVKRHYVTSNTRTRRGPYKITVEKVRKLRNHF